MAPILREAAQVADAPAAAVGSSAGLSLGEIKAIAAEVGIDPAHVERAARLVPGHGRESVLERVIGGPVRHTRSARLDTELTEERASRLLSAVRAIADQPGEGNADAFGMSWQSFKGFNRITVTAHSEADGTTLRVRVDRGWSLFWTAFLSQLGIVMSIWVLIETVSEYGELAALAAIPAGVLALARAFWASSTGTIRDHVGALVDKLTEAMAHSSGESDASERN